MTDPERPGTSGMVLAYVLVAVVVWTSILVLWLSANGYLK